MNKTNIHHLILTLALLWLMPSLSSAQEASPDCQAIARRIEELTNEARCQQGLEAAIHVDYLARAATGHSAEMMELGYFSHTSPTPHVATPKLRIIAAGGWDTETGENIYRCTGISAEAVAQRAVTGWLGSPAHYKNMMSTSYNSMGVGVGVVRRGDTFYVTQNFSKQSLAVVGSSATVLGGEIQLVLQGTVRQGSPHGALFVDGVHKGSFEADANGGFVARVVAPPGSVVSVGQQKAQWSYTITLLLPPLSVDVASFGSR